MNTEIWGLLLDYRNAVTFSAIHSFIHSFNSYIYLLSIHCVAGPMQDAGDILCGDWDRRAVFPREACSLLLLFSV